VNTLHLIVVFSAAAQVVAVAGSFIAVDRSNRRHARRLMKELAERDEIRARAAKLDSLWSEVSALRRETKERHDRLESLINARLARLEERDALFGLRPAVR
jgi:Flp pilus assembly protein TadB